MSHVSAAGAGTEPAASPVPRRVQKPRWLDVRLLVGVVLVLGSVLLGARIVSAADDSYTIASAGRDLAAGTVLTAADVRMAKVQLPDHGHGLYVQTSAAAVGRTLSRDVSAGELLTVDSLARTAAHTTITVAFASGAAPDLRSGQRITIWLSTPTCPSVVLVPQVAVQSVRKDGSGTFDTGDAGQNVVIDVDSATAQRVNTALSSQDATLRAGVLSGQVSSGSAPQSLDGCLSSSTSGSSSDGK